MSNKQVSQLTAASELTGDELLHVVQGGNSRKATVDQLLSVPPPGQGWALFVDAATALEANAVTIPANTRTLISIDGGAGSITTYVNGSGITWTSNEHRGATNGDSYSWRLGFRAKKTGGGNAYMTVDQDISDGAGTFIIGAQEHALRNDTVGHPFTFNFLGYALDTFATNGMRFYITSTVEIQLWAKSVFIRKDYQV